MTLISSPNPSSREQDSNVGISIRNRLHGLFGRLADRQKKSLGPNQQYSLSTYELLDSYAGMEIIAGSASAIALQGIFLSGPRLLEPRFVHGGVAQNKGKKLLTISPDMTNPIWLPASNFVYSSEFENWSQGRGSNPKEDTNSSALIRRYARRSASTAPPIGLTYAYVQPDGLAMFGVSDGSHRVGASLARGDDMIAVGGGLLVYELAQIVFSPELTTARTA